MVAEAGEIISAPAKAAIRNAILIFSPLIHGMPAAQLATVQVSWLSNRRLCGDTPASANLVAVLYTNGNTQRLAISRQIFVGASNLFPISTGSVDVNAITRSVMGLKIERKMGSPRRCRHSGIPTVQHNRRRESPSADGDIC